MSKNIEKEIIRLINEIAKDEVTLMRADRLADLDNVRAYGNSINRKMEMVKLLRKDEA